MSDKEWHPGTLKNPRHRTVVHVIEPTEQDWADYHKAVEALDYLNNSTYYHEGGPDYESYISEPRPREEYEYTETWAEYRERYNREEGRDISEALRMIATNTRFPAPVIDHAQWRRIEKLRNTTN